MDPSGIEHPSEAEIAQATDILQKLVSHREALGELPEAARRELLIAAGKLSRPDKLEMMKAAKRIRRIKKARDRTADEALRNRSQIRVQREQAVFIAPAKTTASTQRRLTQPRACYVCKNAYHELHFFYDSMCPDCARLNYEKRFQSADLSGQVALVTGARVKIGFHIALKLLRAGAFVIATTRFPKDAASRYSREKDYNEWSDRLHIYGLDLRHSPSVEILANFIARQYERLDHLINNAAQTVRRPPGFYRHLMEAENARVVPSEQCRLLESFERCKKELGEHLDAPNSSLVSKERSFLQADVGLTDSAGLSQIPYAYDDATAAGLDAFPQGKVDADLQQIDLRKTNSWRLALPDVPTPEMLEVHLVNAVAPFILCSKLYRLMKRHRTDQKHIVNVSAMEGKFTRFTKTDKHPHTNMAKAALNMMTATSASGYAKDGIFMNAVDTGWVTDEDPSIHATRKKEELNFQPPLDIVDGASRVVDPIFSGMNTGEHVFGKFLKDYFPTTW